MGDGPPQRRSAGPIGRSQRSDRYRSEVAQDDNQDQLVHRSRAIDVAVVVAAVTTALCWLNMAHYQWFDVDDWRLSLQAMSWRGIIRPYNGHLCAVPILLYKVLQELFGFSTYLPYRIVGQGSLVLVGLAMYFTTRRRITAPIAGVVAMSLLWAHGVHLNVPAFNHYLTLVGAITCAWLLNRPSSRRTDALLAGALVFSFCSADGAVAIAVACIAHSFCTRAPLRRWAASILPLALWAMWWVLLGRYGITPAAHTHAPVAHPVTAVIHSLWYSFIATGIGFTPFGVALFIAFVVRAAWQLRKGLAEAANIVAWTSAFVVWWVGLIIMRGRMAALDPFRYTLFATVLLMLAVMPDRPIDLDRIALIRDHRAEHRRGVVGFAGVALIALSASAFAAVQLTGVHANAVYMDSGGRRTRASAAMAMVGPQVLPDHHDMGTWFYSITAGQTRELGERFGGMPKPSAETVRPVLALVEVTRIPGASSAGHCPATTTPVVLGAGSYIVTGESKTGTDLEARFPGLAWTGFHHIAPGESLRLGVPTRLTEGPMQVTGNATPIRILHTHTRSNARRCVS